VPSVLILFAVTVLVGVLVSLSIAKIPFGIGAVFREMLGSWALLLLFWFVVSILHFPFRF
tara:strand:- start:7 stop:186 length:180 start_codon:yes stop_codon:yes gene_type:complete